MAILTGTNIGAPGTYVFGVTSGARPITPQAFNCVYMIGSASIGVKNTPTLIQSSTDFTNQFGVSLSKPSVDLFYANNTYGILYFINTAIAPKYVATPVLIGAATRVAAGTLTLTINGKIYTVVAQGTESQAAISANFQALINADSIISTEVTATIDPSGVLNLVGNNPLLTLSITGSAGLTIAQVSLTSPSQSDWIYTITNTFDPDLQAGIVVAPEIFQNYAAIVRLACANAIQILVSGNKYQWLAFLDPGVPAEISTVPRAMAEAATYTSPQGHLAYYYPYGIDLLNRVVPVSAGMAGLAIARWTAQGYSEPPAGAQYNLQGINSLTYSATWTEQNIANPVGVNLILNKPRLGIVCWGARTLSADPYFRFVTTRLILNLTINSLRQGYDFELFSGIGGSGQILFDLQRKATALLDAFWRAGLFYGAAAGDAYQVISDASVQVPTLLENGIVNMFVWVVPATILERLIIQVSRVGIGQLRIAVATDIQTLIQQQQQASNTTGTSGTSTGTGTGSSGGSTSI